jgi:hypothetical protein
MITGINSFRTNSLAISLLWCGAAFAQTTTLTYSIGNNQTMPGAGHPGESQSTVVPPGKNASCPAGRFLASDDSQLPTALMVRGRDLSGNAPDIVSNFDPPYHPDKYTYLTNDHDLLTLNDGTVFFLTGAGSKEQFWPRPTPAWAAVTFRGSFGPGTRSVLLTWRSTDCGKNFKFLNTMDPAFEEDGSCANPQAVKSPVPPQQFDMGGTDGQTVRADPSTGNLFLTFKCVGSNVATVNGKLALTTPLNKTLVMVLPNKGNTWYSLGFMPNIEWWRFGIVPLTPTSVAFGFWNDVVVGSGALPGKFSFSAAQAPPSGNWGWSGSNWMPYNQVDKAGNGVPRPVATVGANVVANTLLARAGDSSHLILAYPSDTAQRGGYRLFFYDPKQQNYLEGPPIQPVVNSANNCIMHLTAIDLGAGPVLLYWHDVDGSGKKSKIRGRFVIGSGSHTSDFDIAGPIDLTTPQTGYFYGDYHTASGYVPGPPSIYVSRPGVASERIQARPAIATRENVPTVLAHFFPAWVQGDGTIHYVEIVAGETTQFTLQYPKVLLPQMTTKIVVISPDSWKPGPSPVELSNYKMVHPQVKEMPEVEEIKSRYKR